VIFLGGIDIPLHGIPAFVVARARLLAIFTMHAMNLAVLDVDRAALASAAPRSAMFLRKPALAGARLRPAGSLH